MNPGCVQPSTRGGSNGPPLLTSFKDREAGRNHCERSDAHALPQTDVEGFESRRSRKAEV
jgi:hypothetical protein